MKNNIEKRENLCKMKNSKKLSFIFWTQNSIFPTLLMIYFINSNILIFVAHWKQNHVILSKHLGSPLSGIIFDHKINCIRFARNRLKLLESVCCSITGEIWDDLTPLCPSCRWLTSSVQIYPHNLLLIYLPPTIYFPLYLQ